MRGHSEPIGPPATVPPGESGIGRCASPAARKLGSYRNFSGDSAPARPPRHAVTRTSPPVINSFEAAAILCATLPAAVPIDLSGVRPGRISVRSSTDSVTVTWPDENGKSWTAEFSLDPKKPLITAIAVNGAKVIERARPFYSCSTGKRRGGWDAFFDFPPSHPEGTRSFLGKFELQSARASSAGNRVEITFDGLDLGIFKGALRYQFFPGSRLIEQSAVVSTSEPDTAYIYTAGDRKSVV